MKVADAGQNVMGAVTADPTFSGFHVLPSI